MTDTEQQPERVEADFLRHLRSINAARLAAWEGEENKTDGLFHAVEMGGEVGEVLNVVKKLHREALGWRGSRASREDLAEEIGDVLICLDKLAAHYSLDLEAATIAKFNVTSEKNAFPHRLTALTEAGRAGVGDGWRHALTLARPIVESDCAAAKGYADADWEGMSYNALEAIDAALAAAPTPPLPADVPAPDVKRMREALRDAADLTVHWDEVSDFDPLSRGRDRDEYFADMEARGYAEFVSVDDDALDDPFASERGIEPGSMMWRLTAHGAALRAALSQEPRP